MNIDILTIFPSIFKGPLDESILRIAQEKKLVHIALHDFREYTLDKHNKVDDYPYGGGAGMVLMAQPIASCMDELMQKKTYDEVIFLTPDGEKLNQNIVNELSTKKNILMLCGRYKGVDERIRQKYITKEISIGDYVISGGELAAAVLTDAIVRVIPGVIGDAESALSDSFQDHLLSPPVYTRPQKILDLKVPDVLLSGHQKAIEEWHQKQAIKRTQERRPDLLQGEETSQNKNPKT